VDRDLLKEKVKSGVLKLLVGTDAASTGLNLQTLGSLINLDLPWNPTTLEQRKGRVQRGTIGKRIPFCNLRYDEGVEQRLFDVLTGRIQEITNIFGTVPDFITDRWVDEMLENRELSESDLVKLVSDKEISPFPRFANNGPSTCGSPPQKSPDPRKSGQVRYRPWGTGRDALGPRCAR
jgi:superfamily II DNA/RNA helicase